MGNIFVFGSRSSAIARHWPTRTRQYHAFPVAHSARAVCVMCVCTIRAGGRAELESRFRERACVCVWWSERHVNALTGIQLSSDQKFRPTWI